MLHIVDSVKLDGLFGGALLQNIHQTMIAWIVANGMNNGERKLSLCQIFAKTLVVGVLCRLQVHVVVLNLEKQAQRVDKRNVVCRVGAKRLHDAHRKSKEPSCLVQHHCLILLLSGAMKHVSPQNIKALALVQFDHFVQKRRSSLGVAQLVTTLHGEEHHVVGRVDCTGNPINVMCNRDSTT